MFESLVRLVRGFEFMNPLIIKNQIRGGASGAEMERR